MAPRRAVGAGAAAALLAVAALALAAAAQGACGVLWPRGRFIHSFEWCKCRRRPEKGEEGRRQGCEEMRESSHKRKGTKIQNKKNKKKKNKRILKN